MASYWTYGCVGTVVPLIIFVFPALGLCELCRRQLRMTGKGHIYTIPLVYQLMLKLYIGVELKRVPEEQSPDGESPRTSGDTFEVRLHKYKLRKCSTECLVMVIMAALVLSAVALWQALLIENSSTCGEVGYDCFLRRESKSWSWPEGSWSLERVNADCAIVDNGTALHLNGTDKGLECYRFSFNYIKAFTAAGGVTFFAGIIFNTFIYFIVSVNRIRKREYYCVAIATVFILSALPVIAALIYFCIEERRLFSICRLFLYAFLYLLILLLMIPLVLDVRLLNEAGITLD